jgi:hypothetical protein
VSSSTNKATAPIADANAAQSSVKPAIGMMSGIKSTGNIK